MHNSLDLKPEHEQIVRRILQKNVPNDEVWAFGSRTKGTAKPYSDLDLVILSETPLTLSQLAILNEDFSESDLPWKVDVLDWSKLSQNFKDIIQAHYIIIQAKVR
ncbi:DNA polymerase beta subunit [Pasteurellaceae bacterium Pebbles2]|nr:DNA polymerase beta subunit [Pasteurellaceae bacterium Pebbles2]